MCTKWSVEYAQIVTNMEQLLHFRIRDANARACLVTPLVFDKKHFMVYQRNVSFSYITCPINWFEKVFKIISFTDYLSH